MASQLSIHLVCKATDRYSSIAILGSLAALVTAPAAILVARYFRSWRYWNYVHIGLNALTAIFVLIAFALANVATGEEYTGPGGDLHHQLGLSVFIITLVQTVLGVGAAFTRHPRFNSVTLQRGRPALRFIHIAFGIATAAILCEFIAYQLCSAMSIELTLM